MHRFFSPFEFQTVIKRTESKGCTRCLRPRRHQRRPARAAAGSEICEATRIGASSDAKPLGRRRAAGGATRPDLTSQCRARGRRPSVSASPTCTGGPDRGPVVVADDHGLTHPHALAWPELWSSLTTAPPHPGPLSKTGQSHPALAQPELRRFAQLPAAWWLGS